MHSDAKFRMTAVHRNPRLKRPPVRQQGSAGDQSAPVRIRNPAINPFRPAQVVRIHYQILQLTPIPVLSDSYSFVLPTIFVPLTVFLSNSSMTIKRKNDGQTPGT